MSITICVTSCGELTEQECWNALKPFEGKVEFLSIKNVCPQIKALNQMIEQCNTEWLIPVDADMILKPNAFKHIKNAIHKHSHNTSWHSLLFPLWDTLTERRILALKILRTNVMKENLFRDVPTPDVEHYQRLTAQGYTCIHDYLEQSPIGDHVVRGHKFCYFKYRDVYQTYRAHNFEWDSGVFMGGEDIYERAKHHFDFFFSKWARTDDPDCLSCIAGMMDGILSPLDMKSKDLSQESRIPKNQGITEFLDWYAQEALTTFSYL